MNDEQRIEHVPSKKPFMLGYVVRPYNHGKSASWSRIGVAWAHKDDQGYDLRLDAVPVDGRIVLRTVQQDDPGGAEVIGPTTETLQ